MPWHDAVVLLFGGKRDVDGRIILSLFILERKKAEGMRDGKVGSLVGLRPAGFLFIIEKFLLGRFSMFGVYSVRGTEKAYRCFKETEGRYPSAITTGWDVIVCGFLFFLIFFPMVRERFSAAA